MDAELFSMLSSSIKVPTWEPAFPHALEREIRAGKVRQQIGTCHACPLHTPDISPVPFSGPTDADLIVIGEAPGRKENERSVPFIGPAGQLLRRHLRLYAGLDPSTEVAFVNSACCFPTNDDGKGRAPSQDEITACHRNLEDQLTILSGKWVLLVGGTALNLIRPDLKIMKAHGIPMVWRGRVFYPIPHPAAVLRGGVWEGVLQLDLQRLHDMMTSDSGVMRYLGTECAECRSTEVSEIDPLGVGYCRMHAGKFKRTRAWKKLSKGEFPVKFWLRDREPDTEQGALF